MPSNVCNPIPTQKLLKYPPPGGFVSVVWEQTYRFRDLRKGLQVTLHKMCVTSLLCGPWADLWPFCRLYCKQFSLYLKFYQGWGLQRSGPTDSLKETAVNSLQRLQSPPIFTALAFLGVQRRANGRWLTDQSEHALYFCYVINEPCMQ